MDSAKLFSPRQIGVCGGSKGLNSKTVEFCKALGRRLAEDPFARIVSGGIKQHANPKRGDFAADWWIVDAARQQISDSTLVSERILTVVREDDGTGAVGFSIGSERRARGKTGEARRISFVRNLDALIAVGGGTGTSMELALAIEHDIPVLPVPTFEGAAQEFWTAYRPDLISALRIDEKRATRWERKPPAESKTLAREMVGALFASLPRRCFVIMPFHEDFDALFDFVIEPALRQAGDEPIQLARLGTPGDVKKQIDDGLRNCQYSIAVLDGLRHNVLYELGLAHGCNKTTILLNRKGTLGPEGSIPFDISTQQRLEYTKVDAALTKALAAKIKSMARSRR